MYPERMPRVSRKAAAGANVLAAVCVSTAPDDTLCFWVLVTLASSKGTAITLTGFTNQGEAKSYAKRMANMPATTVEATPNAHTAEWGRTIAAHLERKRGVTVLVRVAT